MNLQKLIDELALEVVTGHTGTDREVTIGYASDLLSDVMAHAKPGALWVTLQIHQNIIAVATIKELAAIIIVQGREIEKETLEKARAEGMCLLRTALSTFNIVGKLYTRGIVGSS